MRNENDRLNLRFELMGSVQLDLERVEEDPVWGRVSMHYDLSTMEGRNQALAAYLCAWLGQEVLLTNAPATNGPASTIATKAEVLPNARSSRA